MTMVKKTKFTNSRIESPEFSFILNDFLEQMLFEG